MSNSKAKKVKLQRESKANEICQLIKTTGKDLEFVNINFGVLMNHATPHVQSILFKEDQHQPEVTGDGPFVDSLKDMQYHVGKMRHLHKVMADAMERYGTFVYEISSVSESEGE